MGRMGMISYEYKNKILFTVQLHKNTIKYTPGCVHMVTLRMLSNSCAFDSRPDILRLVSSYRGNKVLHDQHLSLRFLWVTVGSFYKCSQE